jgi:hypothetical protein
MIMGKKIFGSFILLWASLDMPSLGGMLIFSSGLVVAAYIWRRWGADCKKEGFQEE